MVGNPECNASLQPGFSSKMTWDFRVPSGTRVTGWEFADINDPANLGNDNYTTIPLVIRGS